MIIQNALFRCVRPALLPGLLVFAMTALAQPPSRTILVLGDSISAAYGMSLEQGWVTKMSRQLKAEAIPVEIINASISGETSSGALSRLPKLLESHSPDIVILEIGGNDGLRGYPLEKLKSNLVKLVQLSGAIGAQTILVPMEIPPNYGSRYTDGFRSIYPSVAGETGATLSAFIMDGVATTPALMQPDGIHPTAEAQALLMENIIPTVRKALQAP